MSRLYPAGSGRESKGKAFYSALASARAQGLLVIALELLVLLV
jgi:hypothetical protein